MPCSNGYLIKKVLRRVDNVSITDFIECSNGYLIKKVLRLSGTSFIKSLKLFEWLPD